MAERPRKPTQQQELASQFDSLKRLSQQLNSLSEELNQTVQTVEHFLNITCSLGIPASVLVEANPSAGYNTFLAYQRVGSKFRIAVIERDESGDAEIRPWSDCTRDEKLKTFQKLPQLLASLADEIQLRIKDALAASQIVKPLLDSLGPKYDEPPPRDDIPF